MESEIDIAELREKINLIFDYIQNTLKVQKINLDQDYYWSMDYEERYNFDKSPVNFGCGQLVDDLEFVRGIDEDSTPLMLMHLAPILDYLATEVNWAKLPK